MRAFRLHLAAAAGLFRRDATVYFSYRWRLVTQYVGVLFSLAIFFYISRLVRVDAFRTPGSYFAYAAVGVMILQVLQSTLDVPTTVRQELVAGTFERMAVSPFGPVASILSLFLFPLVSAVVTMLVTLALTALVFGLDPTWERVPLAVPVAAVGALALGAIALLFVAMVVRFKQAPGAAYVLALISLVAGFYFPTALLPAWIRWSSAVQPFIELPSSRTVHPGADTLPFPLVACAGIWARAPPTPINRLNTKREIIRSRIGPAFRRTSWNRPL